MNTARAALTTAGVHAVGLTARTESAVLPTRRRRTSASMAKGSTRARRHSSRRCRVRCLTLMEAGYVPVIACIGLARDGRLLNVNADTFAGHVRGAAAARRFDRRNHAGRARRRRRHGQCDRTGGHRAPDRRTDRYRRNDCQAACLRARAHGGVADVVIVDGQDRGALEAAAATGTPPPGHAPGSAEV